MRCFDQNRDIRLGTPVPASLKVTGTIGGVLNKDTSTYTATEVGHYNLTFSAGKASQDVPINILPVEQAPEVKFVLDFTRALESNNVEWIESSLAPNAVYVDGVTGLGTVQQRSS